MKVFIMCTCWSIDKNVLQNWVSRTMLSRHFLYFCSVYDIFMQVNVEYIEGILSKGPYLPCVSIAGRALLAGYPGYDFVTPYRKLNVINW